MKTSTGTSQNVTTIQPSLGGGGLIRGVQGGGGVLMAMADTWNCYTSSDGRNWRLELRAGDNIAPSLVAWNEFVGGGVWDGAIAPSNSDYRFVILCYDPESTLYSRLLRTRSGGIGTNSYTATALPDLGGIDSNDSQERFYGQSFAIDDQNPNAVVLSTPAGNWLTADGFDTYTTISGLPTIPARSHGLVVVDPTSAVVSGKRQGYYAFINHASNTSIGGLYKSVNGGTTWTKCALDGTSVQTRASCIRVNPANGEVVICGDYLDTDKVGATRIYVPTTNSWVVPTDIYSQQLRYKQVLFDNQTGHLLAFKYNGGMNRSKNNGRTFQVPNAAEGLPSFATREVPWITYGQDVDFFLFSTVAQLPNGRIIAGSGVGTRELTGIPVDPMIENGANGVVWTDSMRGIDNTVGATIRYNRDTCDMIASVMDRGGVMVPAGDVGRRYPESYGADYYFQLGTSACHVPSKPNMGICVTLRGLGITRDKGKTWQFKNSLITATGGRGGGQVCALSDTCFIWGQLANTINYTTDTGSTLTTLIQRNSLWITFDAGDTWSILPIGDNTAVWAQAGNGADRRRRVLEADWFNTGVAYFYNCNDDLAPNALACRGFWKITVDLAAHTWTTSRRFTGLINSGGSFDYFSTKITQISNGKWLKCGSYASRGLWLSTDDCLTWTELTGTDDQGAGDRFGFCWGATWGANPGSSTPALHVAGCRQQGSGGSSFDQTKYAMQWSSYDMGATWKLTSRYPGGLWDKVADMAGHPTRKDTVLYNLYGGGIYQVSPSNSQRLT